MQNGDHEKAVKLFNEILKKSPHNFNALTSKGHALKTLGKTSSAILSKEAFDLSSNENEYKNC